MTDPLPAPPSRAPAPTGAVRAAFGAALEELRQGWARGERPPVEVFLEREPGLRHDRECALDLIYNEVLLRQQAGERPAVDEYVRRFPDLAGALRLQFEVEAALGNVDLGRRRTPLLPGSG